MALNAYLKLKGQNQGDIKGSGPENKIMVIASNHSILSPRNESSGIAIGKRMHKPFVITKEVDQSTPQLYKALVDNENISEWELQFWKPDTSGAEMQYYTVKLNNATIASIEFHMPNNKDHQLMKFMEYEEIAFTYQDIEWIWEESGVSASADWVATGE